MFKIWSRLGRRSRRSRCSASTRPILRLVAAGSSNQDIADRLIITLGMVKWYINQIYGKLGVHTRTQAVARAQALRLL